MQDPAGAQFQDLLIDHSGNRHWFLAEPPKAFAMRLQRGEVQGYDFNRMVLEFTMLNLGKVILCAISTAAMDDLEGRHDVKADQRVDQFIRLREVIEERASRKFFEDQAQGDRTRGVAIHRFLLDSRHIRLQLFHDNSVVPLAALPTQDATSPKTSGLRRGQRAGE